MWTKGWQRFWQSFQLRFRLWLLPFFFLASPGGLCVIARSFAELPLGQGQAHHGTQRAATSGECPRAASQNKRVSGLARKIPPSCSPVSPCHPSGSQETESTCPGSCRGRAARECPAVGETPELCPTVQGTPGTWIWLGGGGTPGIRVLTHGGRGTPGIPGSGTVRGNI